MARKPWGGFNEAGAVMPRKATGDLGQFETLLGFNEAGAVMPRKGMAGGLTRAAKPAMLQ